MQSTLCFVLLFSLIFLTRLVRRAVDTNQAVIMKALQVGDRVRLARNSLTMRAGKLGTIVYGSTPKSSGYVIVRWDNTVHDIAYAYPTDLVVHADEGA